MIAKSYIRKSLTLAHRSYHSSSKNNSLVALYSKFAILELCGWIEISIDDIVNRLAKKVRVKINQKNIEDKVKYNSNFDYEKNFKFLIAQVIGIVNFEKVESMCDQSKLIKLQAALSTLKTERNKLAHTYIKNATNPISSPSLAISYFNDIYEGLIEFEKTLKLLKHM